MSREALLTEIRALEGQIGRKAQFDGLPMEEPDLDLAPVVEEPLGMDVMDEEIIDEPIAQDELMEDELILDDEMVGQEEELDVELEEIASMLSTDDEDIQKEADSIVREDVSTINDSNDLIPNVSESTGNQNTRMSIDEEIRALEEQIDQSSDTPQKALPKQPVNVVEEEMGVADEGGVGLEVVKEDTNLKATDLVRAKRLQEASRRLDKVAAHLEAKARKEGNRQGLKIALRVDKIADEVDKERRIVAIRVGKRVAAKLLA